MPEIKPFRGLIYNPDLVKIADVVAPPYDVISPEMQNDLYNASPYNIVRLILGREEDRYAAAAQSLAAWRAANILHADRDRSLYVVVQSFALPDGRHVERRGFIAACQLEDIGKGSIYPHEKTLSKPREDRFKLFQATGAMFSQIFGLYSDPELRGDSMLDSVCTSSPLYDVTFDKVRNRVWRVTDERLTHRITEFIRHQRILIADGHHRYETALQYRDSARMKNPNHTGKEPYNFVPMFFTNMNAPGMVIFPTHRLLHSLPVFVQNDFLATLSKYFTTEKFLSREALMEKLRRERAHSFGLVLPNDPQFVLIKLRDLEAVRQLMHVHEAVAGLDVNILHQFIFKHLLNITEEAQEKKLYLEYEKDETNACRAVETGRAQAAFLMNPPPLEQVRSISSLGLVMPQKSTYFYPKLLSGLVGYSFVSLDDNV